MPRMPISGRRILRLTQRISDRNTPSVARAYTNAMHHVTEGIDRPGLARAIKARSVPRAIQSVPVNRFGREAGEPMADTFRRVAVSTGMRLSAMTPDDIEARFNRTNRRILKKVDSQVAKLIKRVSNDVRDNVRSIVKRGIKEGMSVPSVARMIERVIPLHPRQTKALAKREELLIARGVSGDTLTGRLDRYGAKLLKQRSRAIGRTENQKAISTGQRELWRQADEKGLFDDFVVKRIWIPSPKSCDTCKAIPRMNPNGVGLDEPFKSPIGPIEDPPDPHTHCTCAVGLKYSDKPARKAA